MTELLLHAAADSLFGELLEFPLAEDLKRDALELIVADGDSIVSVGHVVDAVEYVAFVWALNAVAAQARGGLAWLGHGLALLQRVVLRGLT